VFPNMLPASLDPRMTASDIKYIRACINI